MTTIDDDDKMHDKDIIVFRDSRLFKIHLDKNQQTNVEHKTETFAAVYKKLTGKEVTFEFPEPVV